MTQRHHEMFQRAFDQFMLYFSLLDDDRLMLTHELSPLASDDTDNRVSLYDLYIPRRILIGEVTHGTRERIYREQDLPQMYTWCEYFDLYFGKYAQYNESGAVVAKVTMIEGHRLETGIHGRIRVQYGPLQDGRRPSHVEEEECPYPVDAMDPMTLLSNYEALVRKNNQVESQLLRLRKDITDQTEQLTEMHRKWEETLVEIQRKNDLRHLFMSQIMHNWYAERTTREDCPVCWQPMDPTQFVIPMCGHFICQSCRGRCAKCPTCRLSYDGIGSSAQNNDGDDNAAALDFID